jgi:hypothetical protein
MRASRPTGFRTSVSRLANKQQVMGYCLASSLPLLVVALLFNYPLVFPDSYFPGTDLAVLGYIMQAEFLAAASGILIILPLLFKAGSRLGRLLRFAAFMVLGYFCAWVAYAIDGTSGMLYSTLLVFLTFGGGMLFVFDWLSYVTRAFLTLLRWSVAIFAYVSFQLHFDLDIDIAEWRNTPAAISFGAMFFYTLVACEVLVYPLLTWCLENNVRQEKRQEQLEAVGARLG